MKLSSGIDALYFSLGRQRSFETMAEIGYDGIDYGIPHAKLQPQHELFKADVHTFEEYFKTDAAYARQAGIEIMQTHAPFPVYTEGHPELLEQGIEAVRKSIAATRLVDCDIMVMHGAMPHWKSEYDVKEFEAVNRHVFESLLPDAERYGVRLALENMPGVPFKADELKPVTSQINTLIRYIDMMESPYLVACLDTGHANSAGIKAGEFARALGKRLQVLHLHDNFGHDDSHSLIYMGNVDWSDFASALKEIGYSGCLNLEWSAGRFPKDYIASAETFAYNTLQKFAKLNGLADL